jgi:hypothetical protein
MTSRSTYTICNHEFVIECNTSSFFGEDGVILSDSSVDKLDDEDYRKTLKLALRLVDSIARIELIREYAHGDKNKRRVAEQLTKIAFNKLSDLISEHMEDEFDFLNATKPDVDIYIDTVMHTPHETSIQKKKQRVPKKGYVYLLKAENGCKIGMSVNPKKRIETLGVKLPFPIDTICTIKTDDMTSLELELHQHFADKRINGEWFNLDTEDIEYIKGLAT